jgi:hypothetical protein
MLTAGMRDVLRYGVLLKLEECGASLSAKPIERYLAHEERAETMDLRFTRRIPSETARAKRDVNDYRRLIYVISQSAEDEVGFAFDYQEVFEPALDRHEVAQKGFARFVEAGLNFYSKHYQNWLSQFRRNAAA